MSTLVLVTTNGIALAVGAAVMYLPAVRKLADARLIEAHADRTFTAAESLADEVERTRNLPWHYAAIEAAPEPEPAEHEGEVLHVEHPTGEHITLNAFSPQVSAGLSRLADEVALQQVLSDPIAIADEPEHDDEDAPADDTDRPGLWLVLLAVPVALWDRLREWWQSLWAKPEPYRGRHWVEGTQHTGTFPIVVPAQREAAE